MSPTDYRNAVQRVAAACHALLVGSVDVPVHQVSRGELSRMRRALTTAGLVKMSGIAMGGKGGSHLTTGTNPSDLTEVPGTTSRSDVSTAPELRPRTWLSDYIDAYTTGLGEAPSPLAIKRMGRTFKELEIGMPRSDLVQRFARYCRDTPLRFYSVERFGDTLPAWKDGAEDREAWKYDKTAPRPGESTDAYITRLTR